MANLVSLMPVYCLEIFLRLSMAFTRRNELAELKMVMMKTGRVLT